MFWQTPKAGVAIDCSKSGFVVIDPDRHPGAPDGVAAFDSIVPPGVDCWTIPTVETPNGGCHLYFKQPDGEEFGNSKGSLPAGIDVRGKGGYVVAPGTKNGSGEWKHVEGTPPIWEAPPLPEWLASYLRRKPQENIEKQTREHPRATPGKGDFASRSLHVRLNVDQPDPQNRSFKHTDPIAWTLAHRGEILRALYTILLGNPQLDPARRVEPKTRFKVWWTLVGSAIENAATLAIPAGAPAISFSAMFDTHEADDEEALADGAVLEALRSQWGDGKFTAADVAEYLASSANIMDDEQMVCLREFFTPHRAAGASPRLYKTTGAPRLGPNN